MNRLMIGALLLTAFGALNTQPAYEEETTAKEKTEEFARPLEKKDVYVPNPQLPDDINLNQIGQNVSDAKGELTLKAYKKVNETLNVGPIEVNIKELKVMHATPDYSMIDFFHGYTHDEDFDIVKVNVEIKNNSDKKIKFSPVAFLETDRGEHLTWEDEIYLEELTGEIEGNGSKSGNIGFILNDGNIKGISVMSSDAVDDEGKVLAKGKSAEFAF
ncbi:DUF4352 domain-containing protein [Peribacillus frigoritolerans]|uniref:DUF4352 domain-containing protein n=1 Tax=Peribacillus frigoritolerans TaxID=450367 RepID=UPI002E1BDDF6|nr:DUF4352 domain-containing protein [Peribacillus frigoritolerans]